ncbi:MAG: 30S ribosomal protein S20 [Candidatus Nanoarchaeia archaeon]
MPTTKSAAKHVRTDNQRRIAHKAKRSSLKTAEKKLDSLLASQNSEEAGKQLKSIFSKLDKAVKSGTIHPNKASRKKSRLQKRLNTSSK